MIVNLHRPIHFNFWDQVTDHLKMVLTTRYNHLLFRAKIEAKYKDKKANKKFTST